jgi:hypothetical protein
MFFKKSNTIIAVLVASVLITGAIICATLFVQASQQDKTPDADSRTKFLSLVRENVSSSQWTDADLVDVATSTCAALKSGATMKEITYMLATNDSIDSTEIGPISTVIGYGISAYCPKLGDEKLKEYSGSNR